MKALLRNLSVAGLAFVLACSETSTVVMEPLPERFTPSAAMSGGPIVDQSVESRILVAASSAPPLETYQAQFWAIAGKDRKFEIRYATNGDGREHDEHDEEDEKRPVFWRLRLEEHSLVTRPDGTPLSRGDSLLISVTVDSVRLLVDMEPSGLQFNPNELATLTLSYGWADPDLDRDGDVDWNDRTIEDNYLGIWFRADQQSAWEQVNAWHDRERQRFRMSIGHFSGYTVSW
ncbi:MAG: hypothetical protein OEO20_04125 [Gemmatimonadota bacterium]|nr:hypothetical protein [Gemmatimonadota bacterium]MDH3368613.1 hypothetical protein [Gemmatimonadota bacterium]MDH3477473.1 hypothetical protein [Gemmatimonadota bacterium]MDH3570005.1 hypothetical protein [Gemmatimonadota bacterium]MDH5548691.1 hypothetical protein [Gemmatimonadota bacterium]